MPVAPLCPSCKGAPLLLDGRCSACKAQWPVERGVLRLARQDDPFYEGAYEAQVHLSSRALETLKGRLILPFVTYGYLKAVYDTVKPGGELLELGCGCGCFLFGERFAVTALDFSFRSLVGTPPNYVQRIQANATEVDFPSASFDGIAASCFWEHLTVDQKACLLAKMLRWLRPGGKVILLFDTASQNPLFQWFRTKPELFQECFVEHDGHVGLQTVRENCVQMESFGLRLLRGLGLNRTVQHAPVYVWMAPYGRASTAARWLSGVGRAANSRLVLSRAFTAGVHLWDLTVGRVFPMEWSRLFLGVWERDWKASNSESGGNRS
jgi:SAM-dependent methyltransferase